MVQSQTNKACGSVYLQLFFFPALSTCDGFLSHPQTERIRSKLGEAVNSAKRPDVMVQHLLVRPQAVSRALEPRHLQEKS